MSTVKNRRLRQLNDRKGNNNDSQCWDERVYLQSIVADNQRNKDRTIRNASNRNDPLVADGNQKIPSGSTKRWTIAGRVKQTCKADRQWEPESLLPKPIGRWDNGRWDDGRWDVRRWYVHWKASIEHPTNNRTTWKPKGQEPMGCWPMRLGFMLTINNWANIYKFKQQEVPLDRRWKKTMKEAERRG